MEDKPHVRDALVGSQTARTYAGSRTGQPLPPACPRCNDRAFVRQERLVSNDGSVTTNFWLCASCLSLWPAEGDPSENLNDVPR